MPTSTNRTKWPVKGGAVAIQPAWFPGHETAFIYMNMGLGTIPPNMSNPMIKTFQISGPTNMPYPGTFCLPQVPLPEGWTVNIGDNATIQVVLAAKHGAALYNVRFPVLSRRTEPSDANDVDSAWISPLPTPRMLQRSPVTTASIRATSASTISLRRVRYSSPEAYGRKCRGCWCCRWCS